MYIKLFQNELQLCNGDNFKEAFARFKDNNQLIAIGNESSLK